MRFKQISERDRRVHHPRTALRVVDFCRGRVLVRRRRGFVDEHVELVHPERRGEAREDDDREHEREGRAARARSRRRRRRRRRTLLLVARLARLREELRVRSAVVSVRAWGGHLRRHGALPGRLLR